MLELDHIAVAAETLEAGRAYVETALGVVLQPGGSHAHYGTHNMLLGLEDGLYLEVIAVDPDAPKPSYPRWFDLDRFAGAPRIGNWICRTGDIAALIGALPQAGVPVSLSRGRTRWTMAVPQSGQLPYDDAFPACMMWQSSPTPPEVLHPSGCRLRRLTVTHPQAPRLQDEIAPFFSDARVVFEAGGAGFEAEFETPAGRRILA